MSRCRQQPGGTATGRCLAWWQGGSSDLLRVDEPQSVDIAGAGEPQTVRASYRQGRLSSSGEIELLDALELDSPTAAAALDELPKPHLESSLLKVPDRRLWVGGRRELDRRGE